MARPKYWIPACAGMTGPPMRLALLLTLLLSACGQSGDLYLPDVPPPPREEAPLPPPEKPDPEKDKR
jgi:hypothetical protein